MQCTDDISLVCGVPKILTVKLTNTNPHQAKASEALNPQDQEIDLMVWARRRLEILLGGI